MIGLKFEAYALLTIKTNACNSINFKRDNSIIIIGCLATKIITAKIHILYNK